MKIYIYLAVVATLAFIFYPLPSQTPGISYVKSSKQGSVKVAQAASLESGIPQAITYRVWVTAYSSTPEETDSTPFLTAQNTPVRDGIIAANFLPFGTKVRIPSIFGEKIFAVEDRMHSRKKNFVDIWMSSKEQAKKFGIAYTDIEVIEND